MSRRNKRNEERQKRRGSEDFWTELCRRVANGQVIPIISESIRLNRILDMDDDGVIGVATGADDGADAEGKTILEQLAEEWADYIGHPLPEKHALAQVAQYNRIKSHDDQEAKTSYLDFLKDLLLDFANEDERNDPDVIQELEADLEKLSFSEIAQDLGYLKFDQGQTDPLRRLAQLNLPIYVTTSYFDFMERAIIVAGRKPRTQICFWSSELVKFEDEGHRVDPDFKPSSKEPLVYHLFGFEKYPETLVLSEDDHLDFLARVVQDTGQSNRIIPLYLSQALAQSTLILLGYRLQDWDFRVLFRGIINAKPSSLRKFSIAIQLNPEEQQSVVQKEEAKDYLKKYFERYSFHVEWGTTEAFAQKLWEEWQQWKQ